MLKCVKIFLLFFPLFIVTPAFSIEDDIEDILYDENITIEKNEDIKKDIFQEEVKSDFSAKIEKFFSSRKKLRFENSPFSEISGEIRYQGIYSFEEEKNNTTSKYPFAINGLIETKFNKNKYRLFGEYAFTRNVKGMDKEFFGKFVNLYLEGKINENNMFKAGTYLAPIGVEGTLSMFYTPFCQKGQISRKLNSATATGISFIGERGIVDYNIGAFSTTRYTQGFKDGAEFAGRIGVKPFNKTKSEPFKNLKLYGGVDVGHRNKNYEIYNAAIYYDYKKFFTNFEWAYADKSNGASFSDKKRQGFFVTTGYKITPKLHVLARYDYFDQNCKEKGDINHEYTLGLNYYVFKERLAFMVNYLFSDDKKTNKRKNGVYFMTQIFI